MDGSLSDFVKQVPIWIILMPIALAIIYAAMMIVIVQRARNRRRNRAQLPDDPVTLTTEYGAASYNGPQPAFAGAAAGGGAHAIPSPFMQFNSGSDLPEPDFDDLIQSSNKSPSRPRTSDVPTPVPGSAPLRAEPASTWSQAASPATPEYAETPAESASDAVEVMRVLRDLSNGKLIVEIGGRQYHSPAEIPNIELARRFQGVIRELNAMIGVPASGMTPAAIRRPTVESGATLPDIKMPSTPPTPLESPLSIRRSTSAAPEAQNRGIADQIENYLQYKLANTPQFQHRSIHIRPTVEGGVQIQVENQIFNAMDSVTDPEIRAFLMATMREWEARQ